MKQNYKKILIGIIVLLLIGLTIYLILNKKDLEEAIPNDGEVTYIDLTNMTYTGTGVKVNNNTITISYGGTYELTGSTNGNVMVNTINDSDVSLIFDNVNITSNEVPLYVENAKSVTITLNDGTSNTLTYTKKYNSNESLDGALFSSDDLIIKGEGIININSTYDGIVSKDTLTIENGTYNINSDDDGIRGKDLVMIENGIFNIVSKGDSIKSTNEEDDALGYININNGEFNLESEGDSISAINYVNINNGVFSIKTTTSSTTDSYKGIKANDITITGGTFSLDTSDDAIHSNNTLTIENGNFDITSNDDGIHADSVLKINNGTINIHKSYEGLESDQIEINGGTIHLVATDDGINVAGGTDSSSMNRPGANNFNKSGTSKLTINGGYIYVDATGDGLDANGSIYINDGTIIVNGPTSSGNGALDYDSECVIKGGTLIAVGSSGMMQAPSNSSTQNSVAVVLNSSTTSIIHITDANGFEILTFKPSKAINSIVFSSNKLITNESYNIYLNGNYDQDSVDGIYSNGTYTDGTLYKNFTLTSTTTTVGSISNNFRR